MSKYIALENGIHLDIFNNAIHAIDWANKHGYLESCKTPQDFIEWEKARLLLVDDEDLKNYVKVVRHTAIK